MNKCRICQTENVAEAIFCSTCGFLLVPITERLTSVADTSPRFRSGSYEVGESDMFTMMLMNDNTLMSFMLKSFQHMILGRRVTSNLLMTSLDGVSQVSIETDQLNNSAETTPEVAGVKSKPANAFLDSEFFIDLSLHDGARLGVSRKHAVLERQKDRIYLTDLKSTNRTYINDMPLVPYNRRLLRDLDEIRLGSLRIFFRITKLEKTDLAK